MILGNAVFELAVEKAITNSYFNIFNKVKILNLHSLQIRANW